MGSSLIKLDTNFGLKPSVLLATETRPPTPPGLALTENKHLRFTRSVQIVTLLLRPNHILSQPIKFIRLKIMIKNNYRHFVRHYIWSLF